MKNKLKAGIGAVLLAALPVVSCGKQVETDKEVYQGQLPGYGTTELTVLKFKGMDEVYCAELRSDLYDSFRMHMICDTQPDGKQEFQMARTAGRGWIYRGQRDFQQEEQAAQTALAMRGKYLQRVQ